jgi:hypothetical protein
MDDLAENNVNMFDIACAAAEQLCALRLCKTQTEVYRCIHNHSVNPGNTHLRDCPALLQTAMEALEP